MRQYLEAATEAHMKAGLSRIEAERAARVEFGGVENVKDQVRGSGWDAAIGRSGRTCDTACEACGETRRSPP